MLSCLTYPPSKQSALPKSKAPSEKDSSSFLGAADLGKLDVVEKFIHNYKSSVDIYEGDSILHMAVKILEMLLETGADINVVDELVKTALDYAREKNLPDIIALLEEANLRIKSGQSSKKIETLVSELESLKLSSEKSEALVSSSESSVLNQWKHFTLEDANLSVVPESDLEHRFDSSSRLGVLKPKVG